MDLTNQRVVFTGTLQQMTRTQAIGLVHSLNGSVAKFENQTRPL